MKQEENVGIILEWPSLLGILDYYTSTTSRRAIFAISGQFISRI